MAQVCVAHIVMTEFMSRIWVRSRRFGCLVTWFCYELITKPGNKTVAPPWPDPLCTCGHPNGYSSRPCDKYMRQWIKPSNRLSPIRRKTNWGFDWILRNKFYLNLNHRTNIYIHENEFQRVVFKVTSILSRPQCFNVAHIIRGLSIAVRVSK